MTSESKAPGTTLLPGLVLCVALAAIAVLSSETALVKNTLHFSPLLVVIILGMLWRSVVPTPETFQPGIQLAQKPILRWAVAGLGFRLSLPELWAIGGLALVVVVVSTGAALWFGWWIAARMGLDERFGLLLGVGGAICGASAVVAADSVVQAEKKYAAYSLGIITLLGTLGIVIYPLLHNVLRMSDSLYGLWNGASLHEMAQVVAAGEIVNPQTAAYATVVKLARICLLAPVVFYLAWWLRKRHERAGEAHVSPVPWFLVAFLICVVITSYAGLSQDAIKTIQRIDLWLLCVGMAGVGLQTGFKDLKEAGVKPMLVGALQWTFLSALAYGLATLVLK